MKAHEIAARAAELVGGDRDRQHGDKRQNHQNIAALWNSFLSIRREPAASLNARDVAIMMCLLKIARMETGSFNLDDAIDAVGYISIAGSLDAEDDR